MCLSPSPRPLCLREWDREAKRGPIRLDALSGKRYNLLAGLDFRRLSALPGERRRR